MIRHEFAQLVRTYQQVELEERFDAPSLSIEERFFYLQACIINGNYQKASRILSENSNDFRSKNLYSLCKLSLGCDIDVDVSSAIHEELEFHKEHFQDSLLKGEREFTLAHALQQIGSYRLAQIYLESSVKSFSTDGPSCLTWRSKVSLLLNELHMSGEIRSFEEKLDHLSNELSTFPIVTQVYFSRFLIWIKLYVSDFSGAKTLASHYLAKSESYGEKLFLSILKYNVYLDSIGEALDRADAYERLNEIESCEEKSVCIEFKKISEIRTLTLKQAEELINLFISNYSPLNHIMLIDAILVKLRSIQSDKILEKICERIIRLKLKDGLFVYPTNPYERLIEICFLQGKLKKFRKLLDNYSMLTSPWKAQLIENQIRSSSLRPRQVIFCQQQEKLSIDDRSYCFRRKKVSGLIIEKIIEEKGTIHLKQLSKFVYPNESPLDSIRNLKRQLLRIQEFLLTDCFFVLRGRSIVLDSRFSFKLKKLNKSQRFISVKRAAEEMKEFSISELVEKCPNDSRRSIQNDLRRLIEEGFVVKVGGGRSTMYRVRKKIKKKSPK